MGELAEQRVLADEKCQVLAQPLQHENATSTKPPLQVTLYYQFQHGVTGDSSENPQVTTHSSQVGHPGGNNFGLFAGRKDKQT